MSLRWPLSACRKLPCLWQMTHHGSCCVAPVLCLSFAFLFVFYVVFGCENLPHLPPLSSYIPSVCCIVLITPSCHFLCQVSECNWPSRQAPSLHNLFAVCKNMHNWLKQNPKNVCVITCSVRGPSHIVLLSYINTAVTLPTLHTAIFPSAY